MPPPFSLSAMSARPSISLPEISKWGYFINQAVCKSWGMLSFLRAALICYSGNVYCSLNPEVSGLEVLSTQHQSHRISRFQTSLWSTVSYRHALVGRVSLFVKCFLEFQSHCKSDRKASIWCVGQKMPTQTSAPSSWINDSFVSEILV